MKRVYLGGTQSGSKWRDELIPMLKIVYSSPIETAHSKDILSEAHEIGTADFVLHMLTPRSDNFESLKMIAAAVQISNRSPHRAILCVLFKDGEVKFDKTGKEALQGIMAMIKGNGSQVFDSLVDLAKYLNSHYVEIEYNPSVVECLIERDGPTVFTLGNTKYTFEKNEAGHSTCEVLFREHREYLVRQTDFRIYMKHKDKSPEPDFTDEERDFMQEWKLKGADMFLAYVNSHIKRFNESRDKIRAIAIEKWGALLPAMGCPISSTPGQDVDQSPFVDEWLRMDGVKFKEYVAENEDRFTECGGAILKKAQNKWDSLVFSKTGESWPLILETNG